MHYVHIFRFIRGVEVEESFDLVLNDHHNPVRGPTLVDRMLGVFLDVGTEPSHISRSPLTTSDLLIEIHLGFLENRIDLSGVFFLIV